MNVRYKRAANNALILIVGILFIGSLYLTFHDMQSKAVVIPVIESRLQMAHTYTIVTKENLKIWPMGTILKEGRAAYFYAAKPDLFITPRLQLQGMQEGKLKGTIKSQVVLQAINDKDLIYWSDLIGESKPITFELIKTTADPSGDLVFEDKPIKIRVSDVNNRLVQIGEELNFQTAIYRVLVITDVQISGVSNGSALEKNIEQQMPIVFQQAIFIMPKSQDIATTIELTQLAPQESLKSHVIRYAAENPLILLYDGMLLLFLLGITLRLKKSKVKASIEHRKFKDWITEGTIELKDRMTVKILTLEGLVDLAIDLDKRVIYDPKANKYYVMDESLVYIHDSEMKQALLENKPQLGKLLLERGLIKAEELETGLYHHQRLGTRLGESLMALGFIDETTLYSALAAQQNLNYFELNASVEIKETNWINKINLKRARALQVVPLGKREDGKLVIVTSEATNEKVIKELMAIFEEEIFVMATRPSAIYEAVDRMEAALKQTGTDHAKDAYSETQREQFVSEYIKGKVMSELLEKNIANSELSNMLKGLQRAVSDMSWQSRREKRTPDLLELMKYSNYLTQETMDWVQQEVVSQGTTVEMILLHNHIVGSDTIKHANMLLNRLNLILKFK